MKDWYSGRYRDPLDQMTVAQLRTMYADCKEAHTVISCRLEQARAADEGVRVFALTEERKRLAGIGADIRRRIPDWSPARRAS